MHESNQHKIMRKQIDAKETVKFSGIVWYYCTRKYDK